MEGTFLKGGRVEDQRGYTGRIVGFCHTITRHASEIYGELADSAEDRSLRDLWSVMAEEERGLVEYWQGLQKLCDDGIIPELFDNPEETVEGLRSLVAKMDALSDQVRQKPPPAVSFVLALRLEFYMLHPAFETLIRYLENVPGKNTVKDRYESHLGKLLAALMDFRELSPELELLAESIGRVWWLNKESILQSQTDHLTGVLNRRGLFMTMRPVMALARASKEPVGLLIADIDDMKKINDTYGYRKGDEVLVAAADGIMSRLGPSDILGRYGGEEFVVVTTPADPQRLTQIGEDLLRAVREKDAAGIPVTLSVGAASSVIGPEIEKEIIVLTKAAEQALAKAQRLGRGNLVVFQET